MVQKAKEFGAHALALTDHGVMSGMYEFYNACKKEDMKPIIGCELYMKEKLQDGNKSFK
jgi:DNA polymerase-3 subunit alpha